MLEILNINCKENQGWRIDKNKPFEAFWITIGGKDLYVPIAKDSIEESSKIEESVYVNKNSLRLNQFDITKNAKGVTMVRNNNKSSWDKSLLIAFNTPNGEEIKNIEVKSDSNCLLDVLYFHSSEDKKSIAMVINVPSFISVKNIARDNSILIHYGDEKDEKVDAQIILPYYLNNDKCLTQTFVSKVKALKTQRKLTYTKSFRQKILLVPDSFTYEDICKMKEERNLQFVKALHYKEASDYIKENKYQLYDILFLKDTQQDTVEQGKKVYMDMINSLTKSITENGKNARVYVSRNNNRYVMWRIK